jgi:hypothetical protein
LVTRPNWPLYLVIVEVSLIGWVQFTLKGGRPPIESAGAADSSSANASYNYSLSKAHSTQPGNAKGIAVRYDHGYEVSGAGAGAVCDECRVTEDPVKSIKTIGSP